VTKHREYFNIIADVRLKFGRRTRRQSGAVRKLARADWRKVSTLASAHVLPSAPSLEERRWTPVTHSGPDAATLTSRGAIQSSIYSLQGVMHHGR